MARDRIRGTGSFSDRPEPRKGPDRAIQGTVGVSTGPSAADRVRAPRGEPARATATVQVPAWLGADERRRMPIVDMPAAATMNVRGEPETPEAMMLRLTGIDITVCRQCGRGTLRRTLVLASQIRASMRVPAGRPP